MQEYLYAHLRRSVETHGAVVEWTYSMLHALHRLQHPPPAVDYFRAVSVACIHVNNVLRPSRMEARSGAVTQGRVRALT